MPNGEYVAAPGTLVYWDSLVAGLVPCRIKSAEMLGRVAHLRVEVTADREPYRRGETFRLMVSVVVPRDRVRRRGFSTVVLPYAWKMP